MNSAQRQDRINLLRKAATLHRQEMGNSPTDEQQLQYHELLTELERVQRIEAGYRSIMNFAKSYFRGDPPHDLLKPDTPSPPFHDEICQHLRECAISPDEHKTAIAAPRSHAKSTLITNIFPLWCVCYAEDIMDRYWVIIGDKQDNARKFLDVVKDEIEKNELLISDFGNLRGDTWNAYEIITANGVKISAHGAQEGLRGVRYGSFRPSVIMDDIESDESCSTPDRIQKMVDWFDRTVLPLGDPKHSKYFLVGTIIHYNSLLSQIIKNRPDWISYKYAAIERFPDRMDMWATWEAIYHSRTEGSDHIEAARNARSKAMAYYCENSALMHEGAVVLWPERLDLLALMERRAVRRIAFNSEYQNNPVDSDTRIFNNITYFNLGDLDLGACDMYGACDPSMGTSKRSDPSAIVTIARHRKTGVLYVTDVDLKRRHPDEIILTIIKKARQYNYKLFSIETVAFQAFLRDELVKRSAEQRLYLPIREFKSTVKKEIRIAAIEPLVTNALIRFQHNQHDLLEEMAYFPKATRDDCTDALSQCVELAKVAGRLVYAKI